MVLRPKALLAPALLVALVVLPLPACKPSLGGVRVNVSLIGDTKTQCLIGSAKSATGSASYSDPVPRDSSDLVFGIQETPELVGELTVGINLFTTANCSGQPHASTTQLTTLKRGEITALNFVFDFTPDGGTDAGTDDGGADAGCDLSQCTSPPTCRGTPATCVDGGCQYAPLTEGTPCGDAGVCNGSGQCGPNVCPFFPMGSPCDDGLACTTGDTCQNATTCRGNCQAPASPQCATRVVPIMCGGDGGCQYTPAPANNFCGSGGRCDGAGGCATWFPFPPSNFADDVRAFPQPTAAWTAAPGSDGGACVMDTSGATPGPREPGANCGFLGMGQVYAPSDGGAELAIFAATSLVVPAGLEMQFVGARPAVLAILGDATINGTVSAAAGTGEEPPAGTGPSLCPVRDGAASQQGAGGGSFRTIGGKGGNGGAVGTVNGTADGQPLRGGCAGGRGNGLTGGDGGVGGGALQLTVAGALVVDGGVITVSGAGGQGGDGANAGGGGGGSGGTILLEASQVRLLSCALTANGGGGGQGGKSTTMGEAGSDGRRTAAMAAPGGNTGGIGGNGGNGAVLANDGADGSGGGGGEGGGGGGGAVGLLRVNAMVCTTSGTVIVSGERTGTTCN